MKHCLINLQLISCLIILTHCGYIGLIILSYWNFITYINMILWYWQSYHKMMRIFARWWTKWSVLHLGEINNVCILCKIQRRYQRKAGATWSEANQCIAKQGLSTSSRASSFYFRHLLDFCCWRLIGWTLWNAFCFCWCWCH